MNKSQSLRNMKSVLAFIFSNFSIAIYSLHFMETYCCKLKSENLVSKDDSKF